ncbi:MAG: NADH-quinone oxidoreductase subunit L, partial [Thermoprotei archaeon]
MGTEEALVLSIISPYVGSFIILITRRFAREIGVFSILISALLITYSSLLPHRVFRGLVLMDGLSLTLALISSWLSFLIAVYSVEYMKGDRWLTRYWVFFTFFVGSMLLAVLSDNMFYMFIGWEGTGLASYALIGHWFTDEEDRWVGEPERRPLGFSMGFSPSHSGLRAIVFTKLGDVGLITALSIIYLYSGTSSLSQLAESSEWALKMASEGILLPALILYTLGPMAKSAQVPFHEWLVTAMTGPTSVSALIHAATMVKLGVYALLRLNLILLSIEGLKGSAALCIYGNYTIYVGIITALLLGLMALVAGELKLVLALSTASQLGYMFAAAGTMMIGHEPGLGYVASLTHLVSHALFKATLFLAAGAIIHAVHSRFIVDMGGLIGYMRVTFISFLLAGASLAGLPPLLGFWSKDMILESLRKCGVAYHLSMLAAIVTAFYTFRVIAKVFLVRKSDVKAHEPG